MIDLSRNGIIEVNRGDSFELPLFINQGTDITPIRYNMKNSNSEVYVGVMEPNQPFERAIIRKKYTKDDVNENGDIVIKFSSNDTVCLLPGKYYYQIKIKLYNNYDNNKEDYNINTIIPMTQFIIVE